MSGLSERDEFNAVRNLTWQTLAAHQWSAWSCSCGGVEPSAHEYEDNHLADALGAALLTSDWLAERDAAIRDEAKAEALAKVRADIRRLILRLEPHAKNMQALGEIEISVPLLACVDGLRALLDGCDQ